jgi:hypothetical protein
MTIPIPKAVWTNIREAWELFLVIDGAPIGQKWILCLALTLFCGYGDQVEGQVSSGFVPTSRLHSRSGDKLLIVG